MRYIINAMMDQCVFVHIYLGNGQCVIEEDSAMMIHACSAWERTRCRLKDAKKGRRFLKLICSP